MRRKLRLASALLILIGAAASCGGAVPARENAPPPRFVIGEQPTPIVADELGRADLVLASDAVLTLVPATVRAGSYGYRLAAAQTPAGAGDSAPSPAATAASAPAAVKPAAYRAMTFTPAVAMPAERDFLAPAGRGKTGFVKVHGYKLAEGERSVFYAEESNDMVNALAAQIVDYVDHTALPEEAALFGPVPDVDANGKLILLATAAVNHYSNVAGEFTGGFFASKDLDGREGSNHADMLYLYLPRPTVDGGVFDHPEDYAALLEEVVVHEMQHMINYAARLAVGASLETPWLNEGLSHWAEEHFGFRRSNDIRAGYFLADPRATPLAGNCQTLAERGAAYLFVKYLAEKSGDPLVLRKLVQSGLHGDANVAQAMGRPFGDVVRDWTASLWREYGDRLKTETWSAGVTQASLRQSAPAFIRVKGPVTLALRAAPGGAFQGSGSLVK